MVQMYDNHKHIHIHKHNPADKVDQDWILPPRMKASYLYRDYQGPAMVRRLSFIFALKDQKIEFITVSMSETLEKQHQERAITVFLQRKQMCFLAEDKHKAL